MTRAVSVSVEYLHHMIRYTFDMQPMTVFVFDELFARSGGGQSIRAIELDFNVTKNQAIDFKNNYYFR